MSSSCFYLRYLLGFALACWHMSISVLLLATLKNGTQEMSGFGTALRTNSSQLFVAEIKMENERSSAALSLASVNRRLACSGSCSLAVN